MLSERVSVLGRTLSDPAAVDDSIALAVRHLLSLQSEEGYWWAELQSNVTITAEHVFFRHIMNSTDPAEAVKAGRYILSQQRKDGTWSNWHGGPADLSTTLEAYAALKMTGASPDAPPMEKARRYILSCGGIEKSRIFTKIWLAMMGEWPWRGIPVLPPELMLLPKRFPVSIYSFGCWARQTIVALSVVMTLRPVVPLAPSLRLDELYAGGRENADARVRDHKRTLLSTCFLIADRVLRVLERSPWKPLRRISLRKAERWIIERQEADGSWGGIQPPWVYSLIALRSLGYGLEHPLIKRGIAGFYGPKGFAIEEDETFRMQSCLSPVWDTGLAMLALQDAGLSPAHSSLVSAGSWLLKQQITSGGDWQVRCGAAPGGWAFEFENTVYPDTDDTAMVALAIAASAVDEDAKQRALDRATAWLVGMQSSNGGWGAFDRNNTQTWTRHIPFADFGEMIDPPSVDVTAHILECLGRLGWPADHRIVRRGVGYIKKEQDADGSWYGRWGVNRIYGTGAVLPALQAIGEDMRSPCIRRAVSWLLDRQNLDGGWGEDIESYHHPRMRGRGPSTPSQTGWALLALIAAGRESDPAVMRGIEFLVQSQRKDGGWEEPYFTGTGFPTDFMIRYPIYRDVFPLMALGRYRAAREAAA